MGSYVGERILIPNPIGTYEGYHTHSTSYVSVRGPDGAIQQWIRGFTYRPWRCAVTGELIPVNAHGDKDNGWAWRVSPPLSDEWARIRIADAAFCAGHFTIREIPPREEI